MKRPAMRLCALLLAALAGCGSGALGLHGDGSVRGRILLGGKPLAGVRVAVGDAQHTTTSAGDGTFLLGGLTPGPARLVAGASDQTLQPVGVVKDLTVGPAATTELGDLTLAADGAAELVGLRGFGFEERVAVTQDLGSFVLVSGAAYALNGAYLYSLGLDDGAIRFADRLAFEPGPGSSALDLLPGGRVLVSAGLDGYLFSADDQAGLHPEHLVPTVLGQPPDSDLHDGLDVLGRWSFGAGPDTTVLFTENRVSTNDPSIRPAAWRFTASGPLSRVELAGGRPLNTVVAVDAGPDRLVYVPYFGCAPSPEAVLCDVLTPCAPNPACTAEEAADEANGVARVVQIRWPDGCTGSCTPEEKLVARIPGARFPGALLPASGLALALFLAQGVIIGGNPPGPGRSALAGNHYYLLHGTVLSCVDLDTGAVTDLFQDLVPPGPDQQWQVAVAPDDRALLLHPNIDCPVRLYELPGLVRHDLGSANAEAGCTAALLPGGLVAVSSFTGGTSELFTEGGAPVDQFPVEAHLTHLFFRPDGSEVLSAGRSLLLRRPGAPLLPLGGLGLDFQSHLTLSPDGRSLYFLAADPSAPSTGSVVRRLFRLALP